MIATASRLRRALAASPWLATLLVFAVLWLPASDATSEPPAVVVPDASRDLLAAELRRLVPGDVGAVRFTEWLAMPVAPQTERVIGRARLDAGGQVVTVAFRASVDHDSGDVMHLGYRMLDLPEATVAVEDVPDTVLRNRIGGELVARFPEQAMDFRIVSIHRQAQVGQHLVVEGEGISDFFEEGQVRTPFVATFSMPSAQLVRLDYELVASDDAATTWVADAR